MFKGYLNKNLLAVAISFFTISSAMAADATKDIPYRQVYKPSPESNFQNAWESGTSFNVRYGQTYIVDLYQLTGGGAGHAGALAVKENATDPLTGTVPHPRRTNSSFQTKKQGPIHVNATWDGLNLGTDVTAAYRSELDSLVATYKTNNPDTTTSKRLDFYLPNSKFGTATFTKYAKDQYGISNLRPDTFRTKSISGGTVTYEYCRGSTGEPINIRACNMNGNGGTITDLFSIQYINNISGLRVCWHNYDRNENGTITVNGTAVNTSSACIN